MDVPAAPSSMAGSANTEAAINAATARVAIQRWLLLRIFVLIAFSPKETVKIIGYGIVSYSAIRDASNAVTCLDVITIAHGGAAWGQQGSELTRSSL